MYAGARFLFTFILFCCSSIFTSSIEVSNSDFSFDYLGGLDGIPDSVPRVYAVEMQFKFCIACWQMIGNPAAALDDNLRFWLGDVGNLVISSPDDQYREHVIASVLSIVQRLTERSYDGATIPRQLHRSECNKLILESVPSFFRWPPPSAPEISREERERVLHYLAEKLPENEASFNCNWVFNTFES